MKEQHIVTQYSGEGYPMRAVSVMRNAPCACGSGKKDKRCCKTATKYFSTAPQKPVPEPEPAKEPLPEIKQDPFDNTPRQVITL